MAGYFCSRAEVDRVQVTFDAIRATTDSLGRLMILTAWASVSNFSIEWQNLPDKPVELDENCSSAPGQDLPEVFTNSA